MRYIENTSFDPYYNLALEQYVFEHLPKEHSYFMLWQNDRAVIVGKHQNTVQEINAHFIEQNGIRVVRRLSGGGAVYHDLGNINYTFITDAEDIERLNLHAFCMPLVRVLQHIGVNAEITGRNDVTIDGCKVSGNSQYLKHGRILHHGTILFDSDLSTVANALRVSKDKIESKGVRSVRSRVTNIRPYLHESVDVEEFKQLLRNNMADCTLQHHLQSHDFDEIQRLCAERYQTWDWNYGVSPRYNVHKKRRIEGCGTIDVFMEVDRGNIHQITFYGDYFGSGDSTELANLLVGCRLNESSLYNALKDSPIDHYFFGLELDELIRILTQ